MLAGRVGVIGAGLIGGSVALGLRARGIHTIVFDSAAATAERALELGAASELAAGPGAVAEGAQAVVICTPVESLPEICGELASSLPEHVVVTDVASAKAEAVAAGEALLGGRFIGGHPMAGSERHGIEAADGALFQDAWWILTPTERTSPRGYEAVADLVGALGARPVAVDPSVHDVLVADVSHVPQIAASALVDLAAATGERDALLGLVGAGFRDMTRVAASRPDLWTGILRSNRAAVLSALEGLNDRLGLVRELIAASRWEELEAWLAGARAARLELFTKTPFAGPAVTLSLLVPDRPGVLAQVTTAAGRLGTNIEDLRIVHSPEGGRGRLELLVEGGDRAERLAQVLTEMGYRIERQDD
ncbi:MAG: prephenate dehydrogenase/arogenate dehydrogenase family protein [Actinomycetota bacterium]